MIVNSDDLILVTGAAGFIGSRVVGRLLHLGFRNIRCFSRPSGDVTLIEGLSAEFPEARIQIFRGNLLSALDCHAATRGVALIFHLAAGIGEDSFPEAYRNSVVTTRNLIEASLQHRCLRRFVNISSLTVYTNIAKPQGRLLDESCPVEKHAALRGDPYCFAKVKQDELVADYGEKFGLRYVIVRPGYVFGAGKDALNGLVGTGTFGLYLHLGGSNRIPFTYVDNCADAIALAGLKEGVDGEVFNIVDDNLPSSRQFLRLYKRNVRHFQSLYLPHIISYSLCYLWEVYSRWSEGQLPDAFNRKRWHAYWKKTSYSNSKAKTQLGWTPNVPMVEGFRRYFAGCAKGEGHA